MEVEVDITLDLYDAINGSLSRSRLIGLGPDRNSNYRINSWDVMSPAYVTFTVNVDVDHEDGQFVTKQEIATAIEEEVSEDFVRLY